MRDLEIWSGEPSPEALVELSTWTLSRRAPYFGRLRALVEGGRADALRALTGASGVGGVRVIVRALADPEVGSVALDALRAAASDAPDRYAHAIFHPSTLVRRAALTNLPPRAAGLAIYLRADPACADLTTDAPWQRAEIEILTKRYPEVSNANLDIIVTVANAIRQAADLPGTLSVRATDEACVYLKHPLFADDGKRRAAGDPQDVVLRPVPRALGRPHHGCRRRVGAGSQDARDVSRAAARRRDTLVVVCCRRG